MLSFENVIHALKSGNRVRRSNWDAGTYIHANGEVLSHVTRGIENSAMHYELGWHEVNADNWEILPTVA
jgi:hypothetical protein